MNSVVPPVLAGLGEKVHVNCLGVVGVDMEWPHIVGGARHIKFRDEDSMGVEPAVVGEDATTSCVGGPCQVVPVPNVTFEVLVQRTKNPVQRSRIFTHETSRGRCRKKFAPHYALTLRGLNL